MWIEAGHLRRVRLGKRSLNERQRRCRNPLARETRVFAVVGEDACQGRRKSGSMEILYIVYTYIVESF